MQIVFCLLNGFVFARTLFRANLKFEGKHSHRLSFYFENLPKTATLSFFKVGWRRYLGEVGKFLSHCMANLSKTLHISFYQKYCRSYDEKNSGVFLDR